jgi:type IV pilus assembly protein PilM
VVSLPNNAVFSSIVDMPDMSETELESAIQFEAKKYVPLPLTEVILSWSVVSKHPEGGKQKVLLIAVPKQIQENYIQLFALTGLELSIIEIEALALIRSLSQQPLQNSVIIDIGARNTGLNVFVDGVLQLTRNLNIGGDTITDTIAKTLNISKARAEQFKKDFGLSDAGFIPEAVKPVMATIKNEVKQLVSVYATRSVPIQKLVVVGGGAQLPGIVEFFNDLGVPVSFGDPLAGLSFNTEAAKVMDRYKLQLPIAVGLALRQTS